MYEYSLAGLVEEGDTLSAIAEQIYDASAYKILAQLIEIDDPALGKYSQYLRVYMILIQEYTRNSRNLLMV